MSQLSCGIARGQACPLTSDQTPKPFSTPEDFSKDAVRHIETTLARSLFNCDESAAYAGTALAFRDRLVLDWNKTQQSQTFADQKRVYCTEAWDAHVTKPLADTARPLSGIPHGACAGQCYAQR